MNLWCPFPQALRVDANTRALSWGSFVSWFDQGHPPPILFLLQNELETTLVSSVDSKLVGASMTAAMTLIVDYGGGRHNCACQHLAHSLGIVKTLSACCSLLLMWSATD